MAFRFFVIPVQDSDAPEAELNAFLRGHRVISVERRWVDQGSMSFWSICVDYLDPAATGDSRRSGQRGKVDYREILSADDFAVFAGLRDLRRDIAQTDGVPVYTIFNNEQLAEMVRKKARTRADLEGIAGVGDARVGKYGPRFLDFLSRRLGTTGEAGGTPF